MNSRIEKWEEYCRLNVSREEYIDMTSDSDDRLAEAIAQDFSFDQLCDDSSIYREIELMVGFEGEEARELIQAALRLKLMLYEPDLAAIRRSH